MRKLVLAVAILTITGCAHVIEQSHKPDLVAISSVIDSVKDELNAYHNIEPTAPLIKGVCNESGTPVALKAKEVYVTLETVASYKREQSAAISIPIGVASFDPSSASRLSRKRTQTLVVPLAIDDTIPAQPTTPGEHVIAEAIAKFRDELQKVNHNKTPCLKPSKDITLTLAFDVVSEATGGFSLTLTPFELGNKEVSSDEAHQKLHMTFELAGSPLLAN